MATLQSLNPATGEVVGEVPETPVQAIAGVVASARAAQAAWGAREPAARRDVLSGAAAVLEARADEIARLMASEMGKPLREAVGEVHAVAHMGDELDEMVRALEPEVREDARARSVVYRDPFGVVVVISPWNFPAMMPHWMVLPALMAGNAVVLKPSEETPLSGQAYVDCLNAVLPPGVLQVVHGADAQGKALVAADVDLIAFTGSQGAGKHILAAASRDLKRVVLELGGKDALIVLGDADVAAAARFAAWNAYRNAGQVCVSTERIYVEDAVADDFLAALVAETKAQRMGDPLEEGVTVGPMVNRRQRDHVLAQLHDAQQRGARVLTGGEHHDNYVSPTVLVDVTPDMDIAVAETFGPVASVTRVRDDDEAVALANGTSFGLGATVYGEQGHATRVARRLTAGMIGVNRACRGAANTPWVGAGQSGFGFHSSVDGHRQFAQVRVVTTPKV